MSTKGRTYEEIYGQEKADLLRKHKSESMKNKIKNNPEHYNRLVSLCKDNSKIYKKWVEKYGKEQADIKKINWLTKKNSFKKGNENLAKKEEVKEKISKAIKKKWENTEYRDFHTNRVIGNKHNKDRITSKETKLKQRLSAISQLKSKIRIDFRPNYNKKACLYFNELMLLKGINIQHAENGGEYFIHKLGYWVDGYDLENNVVYEYDEQKHYKNKKLRDRDKLREEEIKQFLNCKIIRIKDGK
jgi:hypothetical protein